MDKVRAKFVVNTINRMNNTGQGKGQVASTVVLNPVYSADPDHENAKFWKATPSGEIKMTVQNEQALAFFELGKEYYVDFTLVG